MREIIIDENYCKGCNLCITVCTEEAFFKGNRRTKKGYIIPNTNEEKCNGCKDCELVCPDFAITVGEGDLK